MMMRHQVLSAFNNWKKNRHTGKKEFIGKAKKKFDLIMRSYKQWWWPGTAP